MAPANFVLLPRDLPWERAYDREDANAPQIAKLRLTLPADYPAGTVLKLPMPCACSEHTSRFTKIKAGTSVIIKWDLGICGLAAPPGADGAAAGGAEVAEATEAAPPPPAGLEKGAELAVAEPADATAPGPGTESQLNSELSSSELIRSERSKTGFKCVSKTSSGATPYSVQVSRKGKTVILGSYATAEEGARAYAATPEGIADLAARDAPPPPPQPQLPSNSELSSSELIRSERSSTGFKGVSKVGSGATPYRVSVQRGGTTVTLGYYSTAEEAARVYAATPEGIADLAARNAPPTPRPAKRAAPLPAAAPPVLFDGVELITSERSNSGFKCVSKLNNGATPYYVQVWRKGTTVTLGRYATAEEAALRYARSVEGKAELAARSAARSAPQASTAPRKRQKVETGAGGAATSASAATSHSAAASSTAAASAAEFEVDRILSERRRPSGGVEYLVAWKGCYAPSWEPASNLADEDGAVCAALLAWCASRVAPRQGGPATELPPLGMPAAEPLPPLGMPAVVQALEGVGLGRYAAAFEEQGYDDLRYLRTMDAAERATVAESVGMKQGHADKFVKFAFEPA
ncbi:hypothetical protein EMIHUDRAFT_113864 [Emiliania huxleyi CCMP1516]|uniref:Chromo domain-containing protein n=2 Tax=Emiliania huxleyi TaxID=2903 RepID=A0A0D3JZZ2_EMIH1|nr:hypothetical protein EMIHUDRAFT_113864 [Emiliania huxleyi CCMP1516]EOD29077.1 hypothetical protein EMIHUDRAFT_113864 [Emiliania huxleyi CCMP1516]|eukprot:XP_005781506.1 hypothetical protein EMIHUDRAFT_113864 [Emiliania huxleyi CCMP1516]